MKKIQPMIAGRARDTEYREAAEWGTGGVTRWRAGWAGRAVRKNRLAQQVDTQGGGTNLLRNQQSANGAKVTQPTSGHLGTTTGISPFPIRRGRGSGLLLPDGGMGARTTARCFGGPSRPKKDGKGERPPERSAQCSCFISRGGCRRVGPLDFDIPAHQARQGPTLTKKN